MLVILPYPALQVKGPGKWRQLLPHAHLRVSFDEAHTLQTELSARYKMSTSHIRDVRFSTADLLVGGGEGFCVLRHRQSLVSVGCVL